MRIEDANEFGATSREEIAKFKKRWNVALPADYEQFLLEYNGGSTVPSVFDVPGWLHEGSVLSSFHGIHNGHHNRLDRMCEVYTDRIPRDLFPIADDDYGNAICLGIRGKRSGKIYFWDHEDELDENGLFVQDYRNVFLVANSLQEFLDSLMTHEEADKRDEAKGR